MSAAARYPRVLVVAPNTFVGSEGGGRLLLDLFEGWPASKLASLYTLEVGEPDPAVCAHAYRLYPKLSSNPVEWARRAWDYARGASESLDGVVSVRMTDRLADWLRAYDPQLVYSFLGPLSLSRMTNKIVDRLGLPLAIHVHDDYVSDWPVCGIPRRNIFPVAQILNRLNRRQFLEAARRARLRFSVSDAMTEAYRRRYGLEFQAVPKGADPPPSPAGGDAGGEAGRSRGPLKIFYGGTVLPNTNRRAIVEVADAVLRLRRRGVEAELVVACSAEGRDRLGELRGLPHVRFEPLVPHEEVPALLRRQDILLLPFNFDDGSVRFIRYSWPTKIPEYMFSGVPILVYGPGEAAFVASAMRKGWAAVVPRRDGAELERAIERLAAKPDLRREITAVAARIGRREHDLHRIRGDFQSALRAAAAPRRATAAAGRS